MVTSLQILRSFIKRIHRKIVYDIMHVVMAKKRCGALDSCFGLVGPHQQSIQQLLSLASRVYKAAMSAACTRVAPLTFFWRWTCAARWWSLVCGMSTPLFAFAARRKQPLQVYHHKPLASLCYVHMWLSVDTCRVLACRVWTQKPTH